MPHRPIGLHILQRSPRGGAVFARKGDAAAIKPVLWSPLLLLRHPGSWPMNKDAIEVVEAHTLQGAPHRGGARRMALAQRPDLGAHEELRSRDATAPDGLADRLLVVVVRRGIDEPHAALRDGVCDQPHTIVALEARHATCAKAQERHQRTVSQHDVTAVVSDNRQGPL